MSTENDHGGSSGGGSHPDPDVDPLVKAAAALGDTLSMDIVKKLRFKLDFGERRAWGSSPAATESPPSSSEESSTSPMPTGDGAHLPIATATSTSTSSTGCPGSPPSLSDEDDPTYPRHEPAIARAKKEAAPSDVVVPGGNEGATSVLAPEEIEASSSSDVDVPSDGGDEVVGVDDQPEVHAPPVEETTLSPSVDEIAPTAETTPNSAQSLPTKLSVSSRSSEENRGNTDGKGEGVCVNKGDERNTNVGADDEDVNLFCFISRLEWNEGGKSFRNRPEGARLKNDSGFLPIHMACSFGAPLGFIRSLHLAYDEGIKTRCHGWLPTFIACLHGASLDVVRFLHQAFEVGLETATNCGALPIHAACKQGESLEVTRYLHEAYDAGVKTTENRGQLPLHVACICGASFEVIQYVANAYEAGIQTADIDGRLPLHLACLGGASLKAIQYMHGLFPDGAKEKDRYGKTPLDYLENNRKNSLYKMNICAILRRPTPPLVACEPNVMASTSCGYDEPHVASRGPPHPVAPGATPEDSGSDTATAHATGGNNVAVDDREITELRKMAALAAREANCAAHNLALASNEATAAVAKEQRVRLEATVKSTAAEIAKSKLQAAEADRNLALARQCCEKAAEEEEGARAEEENASAAAEQARSALEEVVAVLQGAETVTERKRAAAEKAKAVADRANITLIGAKKKYRNAKSAVRDFKVRERSKRRRIAL